MDLQTVSGDGAITLVIIHIYNLLVFLLLIAIIKAILAGNWIYIDGGDIMNQQRRYFRSK